MVSIASNPLCPAEMNQNLKDLPPRGTWDLETEQNTHKKYDFMTHDKGFQDFKIRSKVSTTKDFQAPFVTSTKHSNNYYYFFPF